MKRNTIQRTLVLQTAGRLDHPTADEIYSHIAQLHPSVSRGTVYRNLNVLVQDGQLKRVALPERADRFDVTLAEHYHIQCRHCGSVTDVSLMDQEDLLERVIDARGYTVEGYEIILRGTCPDCRKALDSVS